mgnify:CR=1 FL=1
MGRIGEDGEKRQDYVKCFICGWNWAIEAWRRRGIRENMPNRDTIFIRVSKAPGGHKPDGMKYRKRPGAGFETIEEESLTIEEAYESDMFRDAVEDFKKQVINAVKILREAGILTDEELLE